MKRDTPLQGALGVERATPGGAQRHPGLFSCQRSWLAFARRRCARAEIPTGRAERRRHEAEREAACRLPREFSCSRAPW